MNGPSDKTPEATASWSYAAPVAVLVLVLLLLLPIFYVLSIGPAIWLHSRHRLPVAEDVLESFYAPLTYAHDNWSFTTAPLEWYVMLWAVEEPEYVIPDPIVTPQPYSPPTSAPIPADAPTDSPKGPPQRSDTRPPSPAPPIAHESRPVYGAHIK